MKNHVVSLRHTETPAVQTETLASLEASLGAERCKTVIERAVFEMTDRLWLLEKLLRDGQVQEVERIANSLVTISTQIGLSEFALVANDLAECVSRKDVNAILAVGARLVRVGERSLYLAVQFPENAG
ncbi:hypothetical protein GCM10007939_17110 [Amylibacter marinus]|uniref:Uncharacterized protein n=1 Tax=Amylibacter marinus TaxID=1475483 RepID=A0ABQ5VWF3_9RHOB|nr:hypothetical protein [Amylibacter marinus]GLQ35428.1 hypothetical protein GCM10007939_17110 [Amylibacter marinus]